MSSRMQSAAFALLMLTLGLADAASAAGNKRPDPADPEAVVPPHRYVSDFASYRQPKFEQKLDWLQANDTVRDVGGHAGALKDAPTPPADQSPAHHRPAMNHAGHGGHKP
jgi:hypothetical protein